MVSKPMLLELPPRQLRGCRTLSDAYWLIHRLLWSRKHLQFRPDALVDAGPQLQSVSKRRGPGDQSGASGLEAAITSRFASFRVGSLAYFGENRDSYIAFHLLSMARLPTLFTAYPSGASIKHAGGSIWGRRLATDKGIGPAFAGFLGARSAGLEPATF